MPLSIEAALLGVVQGLTEFLPVSSSAHLIIARAFFGFDEDKFGLSFDVACHVGTLIAVLVYFRREIAQMIGALPHLFRPARAGRYVETSGCGPSEVPEGSEAKPSRRPFDRLRVVPSNVEGRAGASGSPEAQSLGMGPQRRAERGAPRAVEDGARLIWLLVVGTVPAVIVGGLFNHIIEDQLRTLGVVAVTLALGAIGFFIAERVGSQQRTGRSLTLAEAFWIGCAQALALVPGVSRSGATITLALVLGLARAEAARFIFLLSIPAILAAAVSETPKVVKAGFGGDTAMLFLIGVVTSAFVGYAAVKYFIKYLTKHSLNLFAWYRLALSVAVVVWIFSGSAGL